RPLIMRLQQSRNYTVREQSDGGVARPPLLLQLRGLRFGFLQNRDVDVGIFPDVEEILIGAASFSRIAGQYIGPAKLQMRQRAQRQVEYDAAVIDNLLKFSRGGSSVASRQERQAADVNRV